MHFPRTLVISGSCLSTETANGRALGEFFANWDKNSLAQFYALPGTPNYLEFDNFFRVTDKQALKSFINRKEAGDRVYPKSTTEKTSAPTKKMNKNPLTCILRNFVWNSNAWKGKKFKDWVNDFNPEVIVLYANESTFLFNIALNISKEKNIPIVFFTTENYALKKFNYFRSKKFKFLYKAFHKNLNKSMKKLLLKSKARIFMNDQLERDYFEEFGIHGEVLYQSTDIFDKNKYEISNPPVFSYAGNVGIGRHLSLIEIGKALKNINENYTLNIYASCSNADVEQALNNAEGINYHGFVSHKDVRQIIKNSDFLFHTEWFDDFTVKDLRCAFSTKIADSLASGRSFILYAPRGLACTEYLIENNCALVIDSKEKLEESLRDIFNNSQKRKTYIDNAKDIVLKNHNKEKNIQRFTNIIRMACENENMSN